MVVHTFQIRALLLPKLCTSLLHPTSEGYLDIPRHHLLPTTRPAALLPRLAHHHLNPLNRLLAIVEPARDILRQTLDRPLLLDPGILISEPRQQVLLVQFVELRRLERNVAQ